MTDIHNDGMAHEIAVKMERGRKAFIGEPRDRHTDEIFYEEFSCEGREHILRGIVSLIIDKAKDCDTLIWRVKPEINYKNIEMQSYGYGKLYMRFAFVKDGKQMRVL